MTSFLTWILPLLFLTIVPLVGCRQNPAKPDLSGTDIRKVEIARYEQAVFTLDQDNLMAGLDSIHSRFRFFLGDRYRDTLNLIRMMNYLNDPIIIDLYDQTMKVYPDLGPLEDKLTLAFSYWKYYFPGIRQPEVFSYVSGLYYEAPVVFTDDVLVISLDLYLGPAYEPYQSIGLPQYVIRRMGPDFLVPECMRQIGFGMLPESTSGRTMLDQMIAHGKVLGFLDLVLPDTPDTLKSGYTTSEEKWCRENEKMIWSLMIDNDLLYTTDPVAINKFIQDGPFTSGLPEESPAMIGRWMGWQIVRSYMKKNPGKAIGELFLLTDSQEILAASRYKPSR